eukprot:GHVS01065051.1.p1 GENE.GHVS01065051.1~~GHVS01065051.1.p1  ORF type:complete len:305 (+),score=48.88 GHVS01065051.1:100-915(+)
MDGTDPCGVTTRQESNSGRASLEHSAASCSSCKQVGSCRCFSTLEAAFSHALLHLRCLHDYIASLPSSTPSPPPLPHPSIASDSPSLYHHLFHKKKKPCSSTTISSSPTNSVPIPPHNNDVVGSPNPPSSLAGHRPPPTSSHHSQHTKTTAAAAVRDGADRSLVGSATTTTSSSGRTTTSVASADTTHVHIETSECRLAKALLLLSNLQQYAHPAPGTTTTAGLVPSAHWFSSSQDKGGLLEALVTLQQKTQVPPHIHVAPAATVRALVRC